MEETMEIGHMLPGNIAPMSMRTFHRFSSFVYETAGIKIPPVKKTMLQARLSKRLRKLGLFCFDDYSKYVFDPNRGEEELCEMVDVITTNKTEFFREPNHFEFMRKSLLPQLVDQSENGNHRQILVWSAGCSSGEEPYTLAMVFNEYNKNRPLSKPWFKIKATDICTKVLKKAALGIYNEQLINPVPSALRKKYFLQGKNGQQGMLRVKRDLRKTVNFNKLNFMEKNFNFQQKMDIIFCRNVIIYFDQTTQAMVLERICNQLRVGGHLFLGHSETLNGISLPLIPVAPTIYKKTG